MVVMSSVASRKATVPFFSLISLCINDCKSFLLTHIVTFHNKKAIKSYNQFVLLLFFQMFCFNYQTFYSLWTSLSLSLQFFLIWLSSLLPFFLFPSPHYPPSTLSIYLLSWCFIIFFKKISIACSYFPLLCYFLSSHT